MRFFPLALAAACSLSVTACGRPSTETFSFDCTNGAQRLELVDVTNSRQSEVLVTSVLEHLKAVAEEAADCESRFTVIAYGSSAAASEVLFDGVLSPAGATEIARDRQISATVRPVLAEVESNLTASLVTLQSDVSDPVAAFTLIGDWLTSSDGTGVRKVDILSDMIGTTGALNMNSPSIDPSVVITQHLPLVELPELSGVAVVMEGVGQVASNPQPPTDFLEAVRALAQALCEATGATCTTVTTR